MLSNEEIEKRLDNIEEDIKSIKSSINAAKSLLGGSSEKSGGVGSKEHIRKMLGSFAQDGDKSGVDEKLKKFM